MFNLFRRDVSWPELSIAEIRRRARILVIDDQPFVYLDLFKANGYTVEKWDDVEDLQRLEKGDFDIILLDIQGVGSKISKDEGLGVLKHLRRSNPTQVIFAYSNMSYKLEHKEFFDLADATIPKSSDFVDFKSKVDELLAKRFSLGFYVGKVVALARPHGVDPMKVQVAAERAILRRDVTALAKQLKPVSDVEAVNTILQIAQVAIGILGVFNGK